MVDYIYKAQVKGNTITYRNSKGQSVTYEPGNGDKGGWGAKCKKDAKLLFNTVNKYFTGKSPNITPQEQVQLRADIAKAFTPGDNRNIFDVYEGIDFVLKTFSDEASEGGKNITPNEVYQMYEIFHQWTNK